MLENSEEQPAPVRVVSEIIKEYIDALGPIWIEGELSQVNSRRDFTYMVLRDSSVDMSISLACPSGIFNKKAVGDNARIKILAKPSWYTKNGSVSFWVREIKEVGVGELLARLEMLKNLLAAEGLFDAKWKKELPLLPNKVGLICGRNSDAEKDVLENAKRRWPSVQFEVREVQVQGADAVIQVSAALKELEADKDVDVIMGTFSKICGGIGGFKATGIAYVRFAHDEPALFRLSFTRQMPERCPDGSNDGGRLDRDASRKEPAARCGRRAGSRADGRKMHDMYLFEVKSPAESKGKDDIYKLVATVPVEYTVVGQRSP